ncbi:hypothetical protein BFZC1_24115 [Lysinibacillus fusiformis ZC1]|nr:hypothetical protein BFZC1_24115 [Lysinibacillus fusiformis ZC1]
MTENNLYFFTDTCDKNEIITNTMLNTLGASPSDIPLKASLLKHGTDIDKGNMLKADSYKELMHKVNTRLENKYPKSKVKWIWKIQSLFNDTDLETLENGDIQSDYTALIKELRFTIVKKAEWYATKFRNTRLSFQDFEVEFYDITYKAIQYYEESGDLNTEFTLVETLEMYWKTRINSFIKSCLYTHKNGEWFKSASLSDHFNDTEPDTAPTPEQDYILKETVTAMFNDSDLTDNEKALLAVIYDNPTGSLREWGQEIGIVHPQTVKRLFQSLQRKLEYLR